LTSAGVDSDCRTLTEISSARAGTRKRVNAKPLMIAPPIFIRIELLYPALRKGVRT
jgi:hypothetical protein